MTAMPDDVRAVFDAAPARSRSGLLALRDLIFATAEEAGIVPLTEALRWGQPAYLAPKGSTLRVGIPKSGEAFALFAHCQTTLIADFREATGGAFRTEKTRAVLFDDVSEIDPEALTPMIRAALTWHERKAP